LENGRLHNAQIAQNLTRVKQFYNTLGIDNVQETRDIFTQNVVFIDPFVEIRGVDNLVQHFSGQYANLDSCSFDYGDEFMDSDKASLCWSMRMCHPSLANNKEIVIEGMTLFGFDGNRVSMQRDYYDAGAMLYEHVPLIGGVIRKIRKRLQ